MPSHPQHARVRVWTGVLLSAFALGCQDASGPSVKDVASVSVGGTPTGPLLAGGTVQLSAMPLNESGGVVSDMRITWASSDTMVARVSGQGMVSAVGAGPATITAAVGKKTGTAVLDVRAGSTVGAEGGTISAPGGNATLVVPSRSLGASVLITLRPVPSPRAEARLVAGTTWEIGPETLGFYTVPTLSLRYDATKLPSGVAPSSLQLYMSTANGWRVVRGSSANAATRTVSGYIRGPGTYSIIATSTNRVVLAGPLVGGALYAGGTGTLTAALFDAVGDTLKGRPVAWSSSDPAVASVDDVGKVTAVAAGNVTITASNEGKLASTALTVLARPVASWNHTADWTTYQGNARHTGEIAATLNPPAFQHLWTTTVAAGVRMNPVTTGAGKVFTSLNSHWNNQKLAVLDARTGAEVWSRDFGDINSVHAPAYSAGRVYVTTGGHADSFLWSFDANSGAVQFQSPYRNQWSRYYAPVVLGSTVYMAGGYYGGMYSFDALDGTQRWFARTSQYDEWVPAVSDGRVYSYMGGYAPQLKVVDAATGSDLYSIADPLFEGGGYSMNSSPVLGDANNMLAAQGGRLLSFDLANRRIGWSQAAGFSGTPAVAAGVIYVFNSRQVEARSEADGSLLWVWIPPEGEPQGTMVISRNVLFVSTSANTYAVDIQARRHTWSYPAGGHLAVSAEGVLFIARADGRVSAIDLR